MQDHAGEAVVDDVVTLSAVILQALPPVSWKVRLAVTRYRSSAPLASAMATSGAGMTETVTTAADGAGVGEVGAESPPHAAARQPMATHAIGARARDSPREITGSTLLSPRAA